MIDPLAVFSLAETLSQQKSLSIEDISNHIDEFTKSRPSSAQVRTEPLIQNPKQVKETLILQDLTHLDTLLTEKMRFLGFY